MLTFVGLGLYDQDDISLKGRAAIDSADIVYAEFYTSRLTGIPAERLASVYGREIRVLTREEIEQAPGIILDEAAGSDVVFLTGGDPMVSTTHIDLRIRAHDRGIPTLIIHGVSIAGAIPGITGLQNYRFGKSCSLPFPDARWSPTAPIRVIGENLARDLHTIVYLDLRDDRCMTIGEAIPLLEAMAEKEAITIPLYVGVARAGSPEPAIRSGPASAMVAFPFGPPLHILVVPGTLHLMEEEYLKRFGGL